MALVNIALRRFQLQPILSLRSWANANKCNGNLANDSNRIAYLHRLSVNIPELNHLEVARRARLAQVKHILNLVELGGSVYFNLILSVCCPFYWRPTSFFERDRT